jgi:hypothetical protein
MSAGSSERRGARDKGGIRYGTDDGARQANPASVATKFTEARAEVDGDELPEPLLPGFGPKYVECGDDIPRFCSDCGSTHEVGRTCYRSACPRCWRSWARRRATKITAKLESLRRYKEAARRGWDGWKFHHIVLSPPDGFEVDAEEPLDRTFDLLKEVMDELGIPTGVLFFHPYRGEDGDDRGFWKHLLPDGDETPFTDVRDDLSAEPHFHAVVLAKYVPGGELSKAVEKETGWVLERITKSETSDVSIYDQFDLARAVSYCLSHTGVDMSGERNSAAFRYFGEVHNFTPTDKIRAQMDAAVRSVSPRTLGLDNDFVACSEITTAPVDSGAGDSTTKVDVDRAAASASSTAAPSTDDLDTDEAAEVEERCNGRLLDIKKAPAFLEDDDWIQRARHSDELRATWDDWREKVDGDGDAFTGVVDTDDLDGPPD